MSIPLNPTDNNYLTSRLVFDNFQDNSLPVTLADDITADPTPVIRLDGQGRAYIQGRVTIATSSPTANMPLLDLPTKLVPDQDFAFPVTVLRAGVPVDNHIQLEGLGGAITGGTVLLEGVYETMPTLTVVGDGHDASIVPAMTGVTIAIDDAGSGYASGDTITLTGGTATTQATVGVIDTELVSAAVNAIGSGYAVADTIQVSGGTFFQAATVAVATTQLASVVLNAAGTDYAPGDTVTLAGGTFTTAAVLTVATVGGGGEIATFTITNRGNYTVESATFTQGATSGIGTGATFQTGLFGVRTVTVSIGGRYIVNSATLTQNSTSGSGTGVTFNTALFGVNNCQFTGITSPGGRYTALPANPVAQGSTTGTGTGATFTIEWGLLDIIVNDGGADYHPESTSVEISGGGGTGGGQVELEIDDSSTGSLILMLEPQENDVVVLDNVFFFVGSYN